MATQTLSQILSGHGQAFLKDAPEPPQPNVQADVADNGAFSEATVAPPPPFHAPDQVVSTPPPSERAPINADGGFAPPMEHPVLRSLASDQADAYAEEVRVLRRRVAALEAALKVAHAQTSQTVCDHGPTSTVDYVPAVPVTVVPMVPSQFGSAEVPAVVQITAEDAVRQITTGPESEVAAQHAPQTQAVGTQVATEFEAAFAAQDDALVSSPSAGFADVWTDDNDTFEEKFAARAFFEHSAEDQPSRRWFLGSN